MKGGYKPIHIQRWAPADYVNDPFVKLLVARRDYQTLTLYSLVLNWSFIEGGDLPADPEALAAIIGMPRRDVERSLPSCLDARKLVVEETCLFNERVRHEVAEELAFRAEQVKRGAAGGEASARKRSLKRPLKPAVNRPVDDRSSHDMDAGSSPPLPLPPPLPEPITDPAPPATGDPVWNREAAELWMAVYGGGAPGPLFPALKAGVRAYGWERIKPVLRWYFDQTPLEYVNVSKFVAGFPSMETRMNEGTTLALARSGQRKETVADRSRKVFGLPKRGARG